MTWPKQAADGKFEKKNRVFQHTAFPLTGMEPISVMITENGLPMNYCKVYRNRSSSEYILSSLWPQWYGIFDDVPSFLPQINITFGDASELYLDVFFRVVLLDLVFLASPFLKALEL